MTLTRPPSHDRVWFRNFYYNRALIQVGPAYIYGDRQAGKQCKVLSDSSWLNFRPGWEIQATGSYKVEGIDANPHTPATEDSCWIGTGTSFVSYWIFLPGGTK